MLKYRCVVYQMIHRSDFLLMKGCFSHETPEKNLLPLLRGSSRHDDDGGLLDRRACLLPLVGSGRFGRIFG